MIKGKDKLHKSKSSPVLIQKNNSKVLLSNERQQSDINQNDPKSETRNKTGANNKSFDSQSKHSSLTTRQIKDVVLVPDSGRHTDANAKASGAELVELVLGVVLCRYMPRSGSTTVNGEAGDGCKEKERKVVVQGVVAGSPADLSGNINRGNDCCTNQKCS